MTTYLVHGFSRVDHEIRVSMLVDGDDTADDDPGDTAEAIAGDAYCFHASETVSVPVPDDAKGVLFANKDELFARVPALRPRRVRKMRGAK
jgi:hypothetical protein